MLTTGYFGGERGPKPGLGSLADLKELEVELDINEADISRVHSGQECTVSPDSYPDRKVQGSSPRDRSRGKPPEGDHSGKSGDRVARQIPSARDQRESEFPGRVRAIVR